MCKELLFLKLYSGTKMSESDSRDAVLVQCVQGSVAVLSGGSFVHVPEALHS